MILKPQLKYVYQNQITDHVPLGSGVTLCEKYHSKYNWDSFFQQMSITEPNSIAITMLILCNSQSNFLTISMNSVTLSHILKGNYELTGLPSNPIGP